VAGCSDRSAGDEDVGEFGDRGGGTSTGYEGVQYGGVADMKAMLLAGLIGLFAITPSSAQETDCPCEIEIESSGLTFDGQLRLARYKIIGDGFNRRSVEAYRQQTRFERGMLLEPSASWFVQNAPCGSKKFCVSSVIFVGDVSGPAGGVTMLITMKKRK